MKSTRWFSLLFVPIFLAAPVFADEDSRFSIALLESGLTENRVLDDAGNLLTADVPLVSTSHGRRVGTQHFEVVEVLPGSVFSPFGFVAHLVYDFDASGSITVENFVLWCNLVDAEPEPEPEFPGGFVVIVCTGEGEMTSGTKAFKNASGSLTRRVQILEATEIDGSQFDRGLSLFEFDTRDDSE